MQAPIRLAPSYGCLHAHDADPHGDAGHWGRWTRTVSSLCSAAFVMMVQTTHFANLNNVAFSGRLGSSGLRGVFAERKVSAPAMVTRCIRGERAAQGAFAEDDHVVQTLATN